MQKAKEECQKLREESLAIGKDLAKLHKSVKNTIDTVNQMNDTLRKATFQGFYLRERRDTPNHYEVVRSSGEVAENLSDGERNFIAFLYFYHLVHGSTSDVAEKPKIVVIDDPATSMDLQTLALVSALVRDMLKSCRDGIDEKSMRGSIAPIRQIFILTHNVYFHADVTHKEEKNFHSTSFFKLVKRKNVSRVIPCIRKAKTKEGAEENYNPVQNFYKALWEELEETQTVITTLNVSRQILEYYFIKMCGYDRKELRLEVLEGAKKDLFTSSSLNGLREYSTKYQLADVMLTSLSQPLLFGTDIHLAEDGEDVTAYKEVLRLIFEAMEQEKHYKMMMGLE